VCEVGYSKPPLRRVVWRPAPLCARTSEPTVTTAFCEASMLWTNRIGLLYLSTGLSAYLQYDVAHLS
jgi:hypothetical protein